MYLDDKKRDYSGYELGQFQKNLVQVQYERFLFRYLHVCTKNKKQYFDLARS